MVNEELAALEEGLETALQRLRVGGRAVVISYHSLEDRSGQAPFRRRHPAGAPALPISRYASAEARPNCVCSPASRFARHPSEVEENPRSRSARLRAVERVEEAA